MAEQPKRELLRFKVIGMIDVLEKMSEQGLVAQASGHFRDNFNATRRGIAACCPELNEYLPTEIQGGYFYVEYLVYAKQILLLLDS